VTISRSSSCPATAFALAVGGLIRRQGAGAVAALGGLVAQSVGMVRGGLCFLPVPVWTCSATGGRDLSRRPRSPPPAPAQSVMTPAMVRRRRLSSTAAKRVRGASLAGDGRVGGSGGRGRDHDHGLQLGSVRG